MLVELKPNTLEYSMFERRKKPVNESSDSSSVRGCRSKSTYRAILGGSPSSFSLFFSSFSSFLRSAAIFFASSLAFFSFFSTL